jgi:DNA-binding MurR/RpiR family transcriptional regulator
MLLTAARLLDERAQAIADVISADFPRSLQRRPAQLIRAAQAGPDDLDRMLTAAGFADLADVRRQAADETGRRLRNRQRRSAGHPAGLADHGFARTDANALEQALRREQDNLAQTLRTLQGSGALEMAAHAILSSRKRWVFGDLKSAGYAQLFATDLTAALNHVTLVEPTAAAVSSAIADAHRDDSLTVFCFRRYSRLSVRAVEQFHRLGVTVVLITDGGQSPVQDHADHLLQVVTRSDSASHSPAAVTAVGHTLAALSAAGAKGAARRARNRRAVAAAMDWYEQDGES